METKSRSPLYLACPTPASKDVAPIGAKKQAMSFLVSISQKKKTIAYHYRFYIIFTLSYFKSKVTGKVPS